MMKALQIQTTVNYVFMFGPDLITGLFQTTGVFRLLSRYF